MKNSGIDFINFIVSIISIVSIVSIVSIESIAHKQNQSHHEVATAYNLSTSRFIFLKKWSFEKLFF